MAGLTMVLAITSYEQLATLTDTEATLNLAWVLDEREHLAVDVSVVIARELAAEVREDLPFVNRYLVQDPYGARVAGDAVARFFGVDALDVTCAAGVNSLLHALALLAREVAVVGHVYPDFPHWVARFGGRCVPFNGTPAGALLVERPMLFGDDVSLLQLTTLAAQSGVVIVDESYANYAPPSYSATALVCRLPNLIVLRGVSKAYQQGGLRFGYCVTSRGLTERVRDLVAPMLTSSLSLRLGRALLELGDIVAPLRARIAASKADMAARLARIGCTSITPAAEHVPYVFLGDDDVPRVQQRGILGKFQPFWSANGVMRRYRLSVPLSDRRVEEMKRRL